VEVMGFEPTASTLRTWSSGPFDQGLYTDCPGGEPSSQVPSRSLSFPLDKVTQGHAPKPTACQVDFQVAPAIW
jgi:hypothetical protein